MSSPEAQPKLDFKDNKTLRLIHEASLQDLLQARNYAALRLLEERNKLLREREALGATKIEYSDYDFITAPNPDALLPYAIITRSGDSTRTIIPYRASRPSWAYYPVDRRPIDASTQTNLDNDADKTLSEIDPAFLTNSIEVLPEGRKRQKMMD